MAMVFPVSTHNYELRYWLAASGINPATTRPADVSGQIRGDVLLSVTPPPQMPATLEAGTISGYSRRRALEPTGHRERRRRAGDHRLRNLEEQSGEGVRRHGGVGREESEHASARGRRR